MRLQPLSYRAARRPRAACVVRLMVECAHRAWAGAAVAASFAAVSTIAGAMALGRRALASAPLLWFEVTS
jgi:hypothetical protein